MWLRACKSIDQWHYGLICCCSSLCKWWALRTMAADKYLSLYKTMHLSLPFIPVYMKVEYNTIFPWQARQPFRKINLTREGQAEPAGKNGGCHTSFPSKTALLVFVTSTEKLEKITAPIKNHGPQPICLHMSVIYQCGNTAFLAKHVVLALAFSLFSYHTLCCVLLWLLLCRGDWLLFIACLTAAHTTNSTLSLTV